MTIKPIKLYGGLRAPNPIKVAIVLEELALPYEIVDVEWTKLKGPEYTKINPNGRIPAIEDPNTGITLWESIAIIQYLVEQYDKEHTLTFVSSPEKYYVNQYLMFQVSGQGPYFGQGVWFSAYHSEMIPSAVERYQKEARRVMGVLDRVLEGKKYLVGEKLTIADLAFVPWQAYTPFMKGTDLDVAKEFPNLHAWFEGMKARPAVAKVYAQRQKALEGSTG